VDKKRTNALNLLLLTLKTEALPTIKEGLQNLYAQIEQLIWDQLGTRGAVVRILAMRSDALLSF
jgi:hypothetical protein